MKNYHDRTQVFSVQSVVQRVKFWWRWYGLPIALVIGLAVVSTVILFTLIGWRG